MLELIERIRRDGKNLGNGILKVDGFINHQVDPVLMDACGRELATRFAGVGATKVLTAEISGIAPALDHRPPPGPAGGVCRANPSRSPCRTRSS